MTSDEIKETLRRKLPETTVKTEDLLSSGSTLLNLACSGRKEGAFCKGRYFWIVGDSSSGKTFLTLTAFAEASINPHFDDYDLIFDNAEDGALMDLEHFFGPKMADRLEAPRLVAGVPEYSSTIEEFYFNVDDRLTAVEKGKGRKFIYLLDSMDSLSSNYEGKKFREKKTESRGGAKAKGDYGDGKAKINSTWIRGLVHRLSKSGCILLVLSQTRDNIDADMFDPDKIAAGGHALKFYACLQIWSSIGKKFTKTVNDKELQIGITSRLQVKKNRLTGKEWTVNVPIYWSTGIDDVGSMIDFLIDWKFWKSLDGKVIATHFDFVGSKMQVLRMVETDGLRDKLREIVESSWKEIEEKCRVERKSPYH